MADITMCDGDGCPFRETCLRYMSAPSEYQLYFDFMPFNGETCQHYLNMDDENVKQSIDPDSPVRTFMV